LFIFCVVLQLQGLPDCPAHLPHLFLYFPLLQYKGRGHETEATLTVAPLTTAISTIYMPSEKIKLSQVNKNEVGITNTETHN
jgi:hypothetical protein